MRRFFSSTGFKIFSVVVAALIAGAAFAAISNKATPSTSALSVVFSPLQRFSSFLAEELSGFSVNFKSSASLLEENSKLKEEIAGLKEDLVGYEQAKLSIEDYQASLGLKQEKPDLKLLDAAVIGRDAADNFSTMIISRGSAKGVSLNDPVIYGRYLVGVVAEVSPTQCKVRTLFSPEVNVGAYVVGIPDEKLVKTTGELSEKGFCFMPGLERSTAVLPNATVCTSGVGGIYPRDLIIGSVTEVVSSEENISLSAIIKPGVEIKDLKNVLIIISFDGQLSAAQTGE